MGAFCEKDTVNKVCLGENITQRVDIRKKGKLNMNVTERPPQMDDQLYMLVNSTRVSRIYDDDSTIGLYQWAHSNKRIPIYFWRNTPS